MILLLRDHYREAFAVPGHSIARNFLMAYAWFCFALNVVVLCTFVLRVASGFDFN